MSPLVSLADLKVHLRLEEGDASEDAYLTTLLAAALRLCELAMDRDLATDTGLTAGDRTLIAHAVLLTAGQAYDDRGAGDLPAAAAALLRPLRNLAR